MESSWFNHLKVSEGKKSELADFLSSLFTVCPQASKPAINYDEHTDSFELEWWKGNNSLLISTDNAYLFAWGSDTVNEMEDGDFCPEDFGVLWERLNGT
jgi:hypothetical protein